MQTAIPAIVSTPSAFNQARRGLLIAHPFISEMHWKQTKEGIVKGYKLIQVLLTE